MSIVARLDLDRADRLVIARATTLRNDAQTPTDTLLDNLSTTGCLIKVDFDLPLDSVVSIGIPGVGTCFAKIIRAERPSYGCEFLIPITTRELDAARTVETVVQGDFPTLRMPHVQTLSGEPVELEDTYTSHIKVKHRAALLVGASICLWVAISVAITVTAG